MQRLKNNQIWLWGILGALFFLPFLGRVHLFDWDEINFAECAREMLLTGNYLQPQIDYKPFFEKPPLFIWLQAFSMKIWGIGEYSARFPNAVCGIMTLMLLFHVGKKHFSARLGMLWAACYFGSLLPHLYFRSGIIDPWFNLFIFLSIYQFVQYYWQQSSLTSSAQQQSRPRFKLLLAAFWIGLAILTKGPAALLIAGLCMAIYWIFQKGKWYVSPFAFLTYVGGALLTCGLWFLADWLTHGPQFLEAFITYQIRLFSTEDAGHGGFPGFHLVVLLVGCFPASIFAIQAFLQKFTLSPQQASFILWMKILFWVVLILFSIVQSKIIHYSSLCYFPLTLLAAITLDHMWQEKIQFKSWLHSLLIIIGLLIALALGAAPILGQQAPMLKSFIADPSGQASLNAEVSWAYWEMIVGIFAACATIGGFVFLKKNQFQRAIFSLFGGFALVLWLGLALFINKIEAYSQRAPITFFESMQNREVGVQAVFYKSYAHLFYTRKKPPQAPEAHPYDMLYGEIDRDTYFVTKIHKADQLRSIEGLQEIDSKNGFVFFFRSINQNSPHP